MNNRAHMHGGAVSLVDLNSKVVVSSRSVFRGNTAESGNGGAVHMLDLDAKSEWKSSDGDRFEENFGGRLWRCYFCLLVPEFFSPMRPTCINNSAPNGGGGCMMWEPLAKSAASKDGKRCTRIQQGHGLVKYGVIRKRHRNSARITETNDQYANRPFFC